MEASLLSDCGTRLAAHGSRAYVVIGEKTGPQLWEALIVFGHITLNGKSATTTGIIATRGP
jgi:hypothetical protein